MYYKVLKGTKLFDKLNKIADKLTEADNAAYALCKELGFKTFRGQWHVLAGGISAFQSEGDKPSGWKYAYPSRDRQAIFPSKTKKNEALLAKIEALPTVSYSVLNDLVKFDSDNHNEKAYNKDGSYKVQFFPGISWKEEVVLLRIAEYMNYKPLKDMIEITFTEYEKLEKKKSRKK